MTEPANPPATGSTQPEASSFPRFRTPSLPPDFHDEPPTVRTTWKGPASADEQREARQFREALGNDHLNVMVNFLHLQRILEGAPTFLRGRAQEVADVLDALEAVIEHAEDPRAVRMFGPGAALAAYVKGLYLWCDGVIEALEEAAETARTHHDLAPESAPDSAVVRWRLVESSHFYFESLAAHIRSDIDALKIDEGDAKEPLAPLRAQIEEMLWAASWLYESIAKSLTP